MKRLGLIGLLIVAGLPALAQDDPACTCRAPNRRAVIGDTICLNTPKGPKLATCTMNQNVTSWSISDEGCESAALSKPPVKTAMPAPLTSSPNS